MNAFLSRQAGEGHKAEEPFINTSLSFNPVDSAPQVSPLPNHQYSYTSYDSVQSSPLTGCITGGTQGMIQAEIVF